MVSDAGYHHQIPRFQEEEQQRYIEVARVVLPVKKSLLLEMACLLEQAHGEEIHFSTSERYAIFEKRSQGEAVDGK